MQQLGLSEIHRLTIQQEEERRITLERINESEVTGQ